MQLGAIEAPLPSLEDCPSDEVTAVRRAVLTLRPTSRGKIIGQAPAIRQVLETVDRVARSSCTVLVTGESGTGKELVVAALHDGSDRRAAPLVTINCGAIPSELVESELFGHTRGAFTGASQARRGHVASAEGGTLFLDEVGELPLAVQVKLLRLLQQREYTPVGESRAQKCDVRIVAATNRDLEVEVAAGRFREDLYYRLNVIHVHLPPLRDRRDDAAVLAKHFYRVFSERAGRTDLRGLSASALEAIVQHSWPGNIRALENAMERGVLLARGPFVEAEEILGSLGGARSRPKAPSGANHAAVRSGDPRREPETDPTVSTGKFRKASIPEVMAAATAAAPPVMQDKPAAPPSPPVMSLPLGGPPAARASNPAFPRVLPDQGVDLFSAVEQYQNNLIRQALARTGGNKNRAAQLLGLNRTTLVEMIRRRGL